MSQTVSIEAVSKLLDSLRPFVQADGGDFELVDIKDGIVTIRILGACAHCAFASNTFDEGIKNVLMNEIKTIKDVVFID